MFLVSNLCVQEVLEFLLIYFDHVSGCFVKNVLVIASSHLYSLTLFKNIFLFHMSEERAFMPGVSVSPWDTFWVVFVFFF